MYGTADNRKFFSQDNTTIWSNELYEIPVIFTDTIPSNNVNNLLERQNEALLNKQKLSGEKIEKSKKN